MIRHVEHVMGTVFSFDVRHGEQAWPAVKAAVALLHRVDEVFSPYRPDSAISRLGRGETTPARCPAEVMDVLALCARAEQATGGYFSVVPDRRLDPSGLVKGWAIERASMLLRERGAPRHCVNGGGDVRLGSAPEPGRPWRVGIAHPLRPGDLLTVVEGCDLAVATSGVAERGPHIIDPHTGRPALELASLTLVGEDLTMVDAYATAAFAMGDNARDWVRATPGVEALAVTASGRTWRTSGFPATTDRPARGLGSGCVARRPPAASRHGQPG
ncbi:FAD:protein FMN transferase [Acrocarpospora macrocephala]|uniref:FAD:protein FMN transferase n=1 Tax=Acrocarpospora macrocephala TaxID=150177 RepID=A0A5M3WKL1_9ACTN|nr:FAD:protein FMN transferase [Acrocarpospora macrocephala]GES09757.1 FAD:protein FMN transferase [Acrocarpospora macrocephala]